MIWGCRSKSLYLLLWPLSLPFRSIVFLRRQLYKSKILKTYKAAAPVIVVGNLTVGGSGKTPLVVAIVKLLRENGYKPGVISRGYGGSTSYPCLLDEQSSAKQVGDEPLLIKKLAACAVVVDPDRPSAARYLLENTDCNIIVSDDGLQHYALERDIEIVAINASYRFGNGLCLPVGPLREPMTRLKSVDMKVVTGGAALNDEYAASLVTGEVYNLLNPTRKLNPQVGQVDAVAGIAHPERFFTSLQKQGFILQRHIFSDHYPFQKNDFTGLQLPIVMTEKDAMRCIIFAQANMWVLPITLHLPDSFKSQLLKLL
jgi:tetraacyldisaccharide 4'-kinase